MNSCTVVYNMHCIATNHNYFYYSQNISSKSFICDSTPNREAIGNTRDDFKSNALP